MQQKVSVDVDRVVSFKIIIIPYLNRFLSPRSVCLHDCLESNAPAAMEAARLRADAFTTGRQHS